MVIRLSDYEVNNLLHLMTLKHLIIFLSALLVFSPVMSSLAMENQVKSVCQDGVQQEKGFSQLQVNTENNCSCHEPDEPMACQDSSCQCDACVSPIAIPVETLTSAALFSYKNDTVSQKSTGFAISILVPPPIILL